MNTLNKTFLPVTLDECHARGWDAPDFVYVCGDAYVDHPSFGLAIISRILEKAGYRVAMLCLPPWQDVSAFKQFGKPRLGFLVSAGVIDSMVNHYTVAKKRRHDDAYAPGGKGFMRPDRATIVYCNRIRQAYRDVPILIGGVEASLRRFSHYDYWDDKVRRLHANEAPVHFFKQLVRTLLPVAVHQLSEEFHPVYGPALDGQQRLAVHPVAAGLVEGEDREPVQHVLRHHVFAQIGHILEKDEIVFLCFLEDRRGFIRVGLPAVLLAWLCVLGCAISSFHR